MLRPSIRGVLHLILFLFGAESLLDRGTPLVGNISNEHIFDLSAPLPDISTFAIRPLYSHEPYLARTWFELEPIAVLCHPPGLVLWAANMQSAATLKTPHFRLEACQNQCTVRKKVC